MNTQESLQIHTFELDTEAIQLWSGNSWRAPARGSFTLSSNHVTHIPGDGAKAGPATGMVLRARCQGAKRQQCLLLMNTGCIFIVTSQNSLMRFSYLGAPAEVKVTWIHVEAWWSFCQHISMAVFQQKASVLLPLLSHPLCSDKAGCVVFIEEQT